MYYNISELTFVHLRNDYMNMKQQWESITPQQEKNFSVFRERKHLVGKLNLLSSSSSLSSFSEYRDLYFCRKGETISLPRTNQVEIEFWSEI